MSSSRDEPRRQNAPDRGTAGQGEAVKPLRTDQRVEQSPARDEGQSNAVAGLWEQVSSPNGKKLQALWWNRGDLSRPVQDALLGYFKLTEKVELSFRKRDVEED